MFDGYAKCSSPPIGRWRVVEDNQHEEDCMALQRSTTEAALEAIFGDDCFKTETVGASEMSVSRKCVLFTLYELTHLLDHHWWSEVDLEELLTRVPSRVLDDLVSRG